MLFFQNKWPLYYEKVGTYRKGIEIEYKYQSKNFQFDDPNERLMLIKMKILRSTTQFFFLYWIHLQWVSQGMLLFKTFTVAMFLGFRDLSLWISITNSCQFCFLEKCSDKSNFWFWLIFEFFHNGGYGKKKQSEKLMKRFFNFHSIYQNWHEFQFQKSH